jgi:hypothetical protein
MSSVGTSGSGWWLVVVTVTAVVGAVEEAVEASTFSSPISFSLPYPIAKSSEQRNKIK